MKVTEKTFQLFTDAKCGFVSMNPPTQYVFDTPNEEMVFFYPEEEKMRVYPILKQHEELNMPVIDNYRKEWVVDSDESIEKVLIELKQIDKKKQPILIVGGGGIGKATLLAKELGVPIITAQQALEKGIGEAVKEQQVKITSDMLFSNPPLTRAERRKQERKKKK